jgi:hypothetical protein
MKNLFTNLSTVQRQFIAIILALSITGLAGALYYMQSSKDSINLPLSRITSQTETKTTNITLDPDVMSAAKDIKNKLNAADPQGLIFENVNLEDLNIYPPAWAENRFDSTQMQNQLISGADADPDNDGLPNRVELLYGSNPLSPYSFCGEPNKVLVDCDKNDKQMIEAGKNPLTGLKIEEENSFNIKKLDKSILPSIQDSFATAETEGVTFTELYEKARTIDLSPEFKAIKVNSIKSDRDSILKYVDASYQSLRESNENDELITFANIYKLVDVAKIVELEDSYKSILSKIENLATPNLYLNFQKGSVMLVKKILKVIELRKENITSQTDNSAEFKEQSKKAALELFWTNRRINDEQRLIEAIIASGDVATANLEPDLAQ